MVSEITLLYTRDLFEADAALENVELSGHVHATNPATGQREYPCLISVAVDRAAYDKLNLRSVTPDRCLRHLNALVSHHPHLVEPATPVRDFDLARYSFVEGIDVVAALDSRPDLTTMTATEFEHFVRQLFEARGLEGWTTERTGDDGVGWRSWSLSSGSRSCRRVRSARWPSRWTRRWRRSGPGRWATARTRSCGWTR